jgi:hypothetical protein
MLGYFRVVEVDFAQVVHDRLHSMAVSVRNAVSDEIMYHGGDLSADRCCLKMAPPVRRRARRGRPGFTAVPDDAIFASPVGS